MELAFPTQVHPSFTFWQSDSPRRYAPPLAGVRPHHYRCVLRNFVRGERAMSDVKINTDWFHGLLRDRQMSQRKLADMLGIDPSSLSRTFSGERKLQTSEAAQLATILSVPLSEVLKNAGVRAPGSGKTLPVVGFVSGDGEVLVDFDGESDRIETPADLPGNAIAIVARTAASPLAHLDGWTFFTTPPDTDDAQVPADIVGRLALVQLRDSAARHIRFVARGYRQGRYNLYCPQMPDIVSAELDWATPILLIRP